MRGRRRLIKNIIHKPSEALQAMVDGLLKQSQRPDFRIDMSTWGRKSGRKYKGQYICYGCAATCAVQEIADKDLSCEVVTALQLRAEALGFNGDDETNFEVAINSARIGDTNPLFGYFGIYNQPHKFNRTGIFLGTTTWRREIPNILAYIETLKAAGY